MPDITQPASTAAVAAATEQAAAPAQVAPPAAPAATPSVDVVSTGPRVTGTKIVRAAATERVKVPLSVVPPRAAAPTASSSDGAAGGAAEKPAAPAVAEPDKGRAGKAWAVIMDREAKLTEREKALKPFEAAQKLFSEGKRLKAIEAMGAKLDELNEEYLSGLRAPTEEERIARVIEQREADKLSTAEKTAKAEQDRVVAEQNQVAANALIALGEAVKAIPPAELKLCAKAGITTGNVLAWYFAQNGKVPDDAAATLRAYEAHLRAELAAEFAPPPAPATTPVAKEPPAKAKGAGTLTSDDAGEVPLRPIAKRKETAQQRAARVMAEMGIT